jgi:signal transduction histidine kinase
MGISIERCENKRIPNATRVTQNTNKYASATTVNVDLNQLDNHLILKISDDGVGCEKYQKRNWTTKHYLQNK